MASYRPTRCGRVLYAAAAWLLPLLLRLLLRVEATGLANLPRTGPAVVVGNHISPADPLVFIPTVLRSRRRPVMLGLATFFRWPVLGRALRAMGHIPVHRGTDHAGDAVPPAEAALRDGRLVGLYPEGRVTQQPDGWPEPGRSGAVRLAAATGAPIVPLAQWGIRSLCDAHGRPHLRPLLASLARGHRFPVRVDVGAPLSAAELGVHPGCTDGRVCGCVRAATDELMRRVVAQVGALRRETPPAG